MLLVMQDALRLPDRGGILRVTHASGAEIDAFSYGEFYGLNAENLYLADSLIDSLSRRSSLKSVQRDAYGGPALGEGHIADIDPGVEPVRTEQAVVGSFYLHRGRKVYELKNHLGNVLAVVSDVKLGISTANYSPAPVDYYIADVVEMTDYEPFGMQLSSRHWVSGDGYRFGFQGQEGDDEWSGEGSMLAFKYRVHDVRLGRFLSVDPLSDKYPWNSSYAFSENRVIDAVELEGLEKIVLADNLKPYESYLLLAINSEEILKQIAVDHTKPELVGSVTIYVRARRLNPDPDSEKDLGGFTVELNVIHDRVGDSKFRKHPIVDEINQEFGLSTFDLAYRIEVQKEKIILVTIDADHLIEPEELKILHPLDVRGHLAETINTLAHEFDIHVRRMINGTSASNEIEHSEDANVKGNPGYYTEKDFAALKDQQTLGGPAKNSRQYVREKAAYEAAKKMVPDEK